MQKLKSLKFVNKLFFLTYHYKLIIELIIKKGTPLSFKFFSNPAAKPLHKLIVKIKNMKCPVFVVNAIFNNFIK